MVSKAPIVNQTQFNGKHGCPKCLVTGETARTKKVWVYRYGSHGSLRTNSERSSTLKLIDCIGGPIGGMKGI